MLLALFLMQPSTFNLQPEGIENNHVQVRSSKMFSATIIPLVLLVLFIVFQHADAWQRRPRRRCPRRDCEVSYWSSWSSCSANSCGDRGNQSRSRIITSNSSCGGVACPPSLDETRQCYSSALVNCQLSSWSEWSVCTATSCKKSGIQFSSRHRITTEQCGGTCTSTFRKTRTCSRISVDCQVSSWSEWSACTLTTCDVSSGIQFSTRHKIIKENLNLPQLFCLLKTIKVHLTPKIFAKTNPLIFCGISVQKCFDLVKSSIFCALLKYGKSV